MWVKVPMFYTFNISSCEDMFRIDIKQVMLNVLWDQPFQSLTLLILTTKINEGAEIVT
jgi:hypothetical protein